MAKRTKAQNIHQAIADDIVHGRLPPGAALDETTIAAGFNVSRTPVREKIRQLAAIGLVEARARRGAVVATVSARELDEMFAVMGELKALCARWSAIFMTARQRRQLLALQAESETLVSAGRREAYVDFNNRFHDALYRGADNRFLADLALAVRRRCAPFRRAQFETLGRLAKSHQEHAAVIDAIQHGDGETAALEMRAHIVVVRDAVDEVAGGTVGRSDTTPVAASAAELPPLDRALPPSPTALAEKGVDFETVATSQSFVTAGEPVEFEDMETLDFVVVGCVAVTRSGGRTGKGGGFADLELGIFRELGKVSTDTPIATTVHSNQVVDDDRLIMMGHDSALNYIATEAELIDTRTPLKQPAGVDWDRVQPDQYDNIPFLRALRERLAR